MTMFDNKCEEIYNHICEQNARIYNDLYTGATVEERREAALRIHLHEQKLLVQLKLEAFKKGF